VVVILFRPFIHLRSAHPCATDIPFLHASLYSAGAMSYRLLPCSHQSCQKLACAPFPTSIRVQTWYNVVSDLLRVIFMPAQGLLSPLHLYQGHRNRNALLNLCKSRMPSPSSLFDRCTCFQLTIALSFLASSEPCHRNCLLILSSFFIAYFDSGKIVIRYTRTDDRAEFTKVNLPILFSSLPFHLGNFPATMSMSSCLSSLLTLPIQSCNTRYLQGN
jgi:hypothetical protein